jgi:hypothetical protein
MWFILVGIQRILVLCYFERMVIQAGEINENLLNAVPFGADIVSKRRNLLRCGSCGVNQFNGYGLAHRLGHESGGSVVYARLQ